jgi:hypothetical protein
MTKFQKAEFHFHGGYLTYGPERRFVARFKHVKGGHRDWINFMCKHVRVETYFAAMDRGESPLAIMQRYGYVLPHIRRWCREAGLPETVAGMNTLIDRRINRQFFNR